MNQENEQIALKQYFRRNTLGITMVESFWGLGLPMVFESTYIQVFLRELGASNFEIGLMPVFLSLGIPVISLLSAYLTTHLTHKKTAVFLTNLIASFPIILLGIALSLNMDDNTKVMVFYIFYAVFSFSIGLVLPVWQNFLVKIFLEEDTLRALSVMHISQSLTKIIGSLALLWIVQKYGISVSGASNLFIIAGSLMFVGSLFFLITREIPDKSCIKTRFTPVMFLKTLSAIFYNKPFISFLFSDVSYFAVTSVISFYAVYATEYCSINPAYVSGLFIALNVSGSIIFQIIFGYFNFLSLKNKLYMEKIMSVAGIFTLYFVPSLSGFLAASFILGAGRAVRVLAYAPVIKKLSGERDATPYFAVAPIVILPVSAGLPILNGKFLDYFYQLGADSYRIMFLMMAVLILLSTLFLIRVVFSKENQN